MFPSKGTDRMTGISHWLHLGSDSNSTMSSYCGDAPTDMTSIDIGMCFRGAVFQGPAAFFMVLFGIASIARLYQRDVVKGSGCMGNYRILDIVRLLLFFFLAMESLILLQWRRVVLHAHIETYMIVDAVVFVLIPFKIIQFRLHKAVQRAVPEGFAVKLFLFVNTTTSILQVRAVVRDDVSFYASQNDYNFVKVWKIVVASISLVATMLYVCFTRDWHEMRLRVSQQSSPLGLNPDQLRAPLLPSRAANPSNRAWSMDVEQLQSLRDKQSSEEYSGLFSILTFFWVGGLMKTGYARPLEEEDLLNLRSDDAVTDMGDRFYACWEERKAKQDSKYPGRAQKEEYPGDLVGIVGALHNAGIFTPFYEAALFKAVYDCSLFVNPQVMHLMIDFMKPSNDEPDYIGYLYALLMLGNALMQTFVLHQYFHRAFRAGMRVRSALLTSVYRKSLNLTPGARDKRTTGEIVNLMSTDCQRMQNLFPYLHVIWSSPLQVTLAVYFLWGQLRWSVIISVATILFVVTPLAGYVAKRIKGVQEILMKVKDRRIKLTNETLSSIKTIKMYGWEETFCKLVQATRDEELVVLRRFVVLRAYSRTLWTATPVLVTLLTFAAYVWLGGVLDPATAFTSLALLNILQFPLVVLPNIFNNAVEAAVSLRRLAKFFESDELSYDYITRGEADDSDDAIVVKSGNFYWDDDRKAQALFDVSLTIPRGKLFVVTGEVGSGKTAFLRSLIGDLIPGIEPGKVPQVTINGSMAYASQTPWILNATLRDNITFGSPFDREWYNKVLFACCLESDMAQLAHGDMTEIGERGINLSGGQKARVAMARALYSRSDIILLETCFEAVDEHVGAHLWKNALRGLLSTSSANGFAPTVVLVTHALKFMPAADGIIVMKNGGFCQIGQYDELLNVQDSEFQRLVSKLQKSQSSMTATGDEHHDDDDEEVHEEDLLVEETPVGSPQGSNAATPSSPGGASNTGTSVDDTSKPKKKTDKNLTGNEDRAVGSVDWKVYLSYIRAMGGPVVFFLILLSLTGRSAFDIIRSRWLAYWSSHSHKHEDPAPSGNYSAIFEASKWVTMTPSRGLESVSHMGTYEGYQMPVSVHEMLVSNSTSGDEHTVGFYLGIYTLFSFFGVVAMVSAVLVIAFSSLNASKKMHLHLITSMTRASMSFFDTTPLGRILNRFSKDMYTIDEALPDSMFSFLGTTFQVLGTVAIIAYVVPMFLIALPFLFAGYRYVQRYYIASSREIKRWDSVLRSPIYSHFSETLEGVSAIRAYNIGGKFILKNIEQLDRNLTAYYSSISANRWLAVRLETIGTLLVVAGAFLVVIARDRIDGSLAGLALSYAMSITQTLNWTVRMVSELETNVVSVERLEEYIDTPSEASPDPTDEESTPPAHWPSKGMVVFENVKARYREGLEDVVKGISFTINPSEKIGIVGRTGAGKSTIFLIMLRMIEPSAGRILIDGFDTRHVGLSTLRKRIAIIPQDAVMFSGTLRQNVDPLNVFTDQEIWRALERAHIDKHVTAMQIQQQENNELVRTDPLQVEIAEYGANVSFGQRQQIAIARAILRDCKVLLMDEATSGIDSATDHDIQETIKTEFSQHTVLTVAHRIETIINNDRVLVLNSGLVAELDKPQVLLSNKNSMFSALVKKLKESKV